MDHWETAHFPVKVRLMGGASEMVKEVIVMTSQCDTIKTFKHKVIDSFHDEGIEIISKQYALYYTGKPMENEKWRRVGEYNIKVDSPPMILKARMVGGGKVFVERKTVKRTRATKEEKLTMTKLRLKSPWRGTSCRTSTTT